MNAIRLVSILLCGIAAVLAGCFPYPTQETPHVTGVVVDATSRRPIAGATVYFERYQTKPVITGGDGRFDIAAISRIEMMPLAPYDRMGDRYVIIEAAGHETVRLKANIWRGPSGETISLRRAASNQPLQPTASRRTIEFLND